MDIESINKTIESLPQEVMKEIKKRVLSENSKKGGLTRYKNMTKEQRVAHAKMMISHRTFKKKALIK